MHIFWGIRNLDSIVVFYGLGGGVLYNLCTPLLDFGFRYCVRFVAKDLSFKSTPVRLSWLELSQSGKQTNI